MWYIPLRIFFCEDALALTRPGAMEREKRMPYQEQSPHRIDHRVAVIDPDQPREIATPAEQTVRFQPAREIRPGSLPRRLRLLCMLLSVLAALVIFAGLFHSILLSSSTERDEQTKQQRSKATPLTTAPLVPIATAPLVEISKSNQMIYSLTGDGTLRGWERPLRELRWLQKTHVLPNHALITGKDLLFSLVWNTQRSWLEAWRASDGLPLWERMLPIPGPDPLRFQGENLYLNTQNGVLLALQASSGNQRWSFSTGMAGPLNTFFFASNQVVAVLSRNNEVSVLRASDGAQISRYHNVLRRLFPSPQVEQDIIYLQPDDGVQALRISDGRPLWSLQYENTAHPLPLVVSDGRVYLSQDDGWLRVLRGSDQHQFWQYRIASGLLSEPVVRDQRVYLVGKDGALVVLRAGDGTRLWQTSPARVQGQMAVTEQIVYLNVDLPGQEILALRASNGQQLWHKTITSYQTYHWVPVIAHDRLLFGPDDFSLQAWDGQNGHYLWQHRASVQIRWELSSPFTFDATNLSLPRQDGGVDVLDLATGNLRVQYSIS
jgi:outer membrane protein assembly factor BamB